ncbi:MAG: MFS transporter [Planctomycetaceae bacterium]|jgi:sugar phosphate permease|nr:MFS transporter [Planctomycetaceae bacterium]
MSSTPKYRWELLALLSCAFFFHQADRAIFGVLLSSIKEDLKLSDDQLGFAASVLFFTLAVMVPIAGYIADRFSKKWIITISLIFWSFATLLTGLAQGFAGIILFRSVATAGGESFYAPSAYPLLAAYHTATRSIAMAVHQAALYAGLMFSGFLAAGIAHYFGWRGAFFLFGCCGILLGGVFIFRLRDLPKNIISSENQSNQPNQSDQQTNPSLSLQKVSLQKAISIFVRNPTVLLLTAGFTAIVFVNNAFVVWAPVFIESKFSVSKIEAGGYVMLYHHLTAFCGILCGGFLTDRLVVCFPRFRLFVQFSAMLLGAPAIYCFGMSGSLSAAWFAVAVFGLFRGFYETNTHAAVFDTVEPQYRGMTVGLMTMTAFLIGSTSTILLGRLSTIFGVKDGLSYGFALLSVAYLIGAIAVFTAMTFTFHRNRIIENHAF